MATAKEAEMAALFAEDDHAANLDAIYQKSAHQRAVVTDYFKHMLLTSENIKNVPRIQEIADHITTETINSILLFVCTKSAARDNIVCKGKDVAQVSDTIYAFITNPAHNNYDDLKFMPFPWFDDGPYVLNQWYCATVLPKQNSARLRRILDVLLGPGATGEFVDRVATLAEMQQLWEETDVNFEQLFLPTAADVDFFELEDGVEKGATHNRWRPGPEQRMANNDICNIFAPGDHWPSWHQFLQFRYQNMLE